MKKYLALFILLLLTLSIAACGKNDEAAPSDKKKDNNAISETTPTQEASVTSAVSPTEKPAPTPTEKPVPTPTVTSSPSPSPTEAPTPTPTEAVKAVSGYENGKVMIALSSGGALTCDIVGEWRLDDGRVFGGPEETDCLGLINESIRFDIIGTLGPDYEWGSLFFLCADNSPENLGYQSIDDWLDKNYRDKGEYKGWITMNQSNDSYPNYCAVKEINNIAVLVSSRAGTYEALAYAIDCISNLKVE
jgi:Predicted solute binding protein